MPKRDQPVGFVIAYANGERFECINCLPFIDRQNNLCIVQNRETVGVVAAGFWFGYDLLFKKPSADPAQEPVQPSPDSAEDLLPLTPDTPEVAAEASGTSLSE